MTKIIIINESPDIDDVHVQDPGDIVCFDFAKPEFWTTLIPGQRLEHETEEGRSYAVLVRAQGAANYTFLNEVDASAILMITPQASLNLSSATPNTVRNG